MPDRRHRTRHIPRVPSRQEFLPPAKRRGRRLPQYRPRLAWWMVRVHQGGERIADAGRPAQKGRPNVLSVCGEAPACPGPFAAPASPPCGRV